MSRRALLKLLCLGCAVLLLLNISIFSKKASSVGTDERSKDTQRLWNYAEDIDGDTRSLRDWGVDEQSRANKVLMALVTHEQKEETTSAAQITTIASSAAATTAASITATTTAASTTTAVRTGATSTSAGYTAVAAAAAAAAATNTTTVAATTAVAFTSAAATINATPDASGSTPSLSPSLHNASLPLFLQDIHPSPELYNIYQLVTSKPDTLLMRHYCSLESFCHQNPNATIWFLFLDVFSLSGAPLRVLRTLQNTYQNLRLARIELLRTVEGTPLKRIVDDGRLKQSSFPANHLSDVLRLAVVAESGGLYADFDFICVRELTGVRNALTLELPKVSMNGLFHFDAGHGFLRLIMERDAQDFNGTQWAYNGPNLLHRVLTERCGAARYDSPTRTPSNDTKNLLDRALKLIETQKNVVYTTGLEEDTRDSLRIRRRRRRSITETLELNPFAVTSNNSVVGRQDVGRTTADTRSTTPLNKENQEQLCRSVTLFDSRSFMPVYYNGMLNLFKANTSAKLSENTPEAFTLHLFNALTRNVVIEPSSGVDTLARAYCPATHQMSVNENKPL